jgi:zinc protease
MDDLKAAQLADVQAFFDTYYAPNNATLAVVGDVRPAELRRLVDQYFADIPRRPDPPAVSCEWRLSSGVVRREVQDAHANLPATLRVYRVPPHDDADTRALQLLQIIMGQGESARLNVSLVRRAQAAVGTQTFLTPDRRGPGVLVVLAIANQGVAVEGLDTLLATQFDSLRTAGVTPDELTKAKNTFRANYVEGRETTLGRAEELHHFDLFHASVAEINTDLDRYLAVTADDIRRVALKYFDPANAVVFIVRPAAASAGSGGEK